MTTETLEAAASEMYAALLAMLTMFGKPHPEEYIDGGISYRLACETCEQARAALRKARGENPA